jgi:hypothetical protein
MYIWIYWFVFYITKLQAVRILQCGKNCWCVTNEMEEKIINVSHVLIGITIYQNELGTISSTSVTAGRQMPEFLTRQLPSESETGWSLSWSGRAHNLRWREFWRIFYFASGVCGTSFPLEYDAMFLRFRTNQWSGNVGRSLCTDIASRFGRTEDFYIRFKVKNFGVQ